MMVEIVINHVAKEVQAGRSLSNIPALRSLPAFMNTAQRSLNDLMALMPDYKDVLDAAAVLEDLKRGQED